jgi:peptide/nickel transport system permease protein
MSDAGTVEVAPLVFDLPEPPQVASAARKFGVFAWASIGWLSLLTLLAIFAPVLPIKDPNFGDFGKIGFSPLNGAGILGTDDLGRDVLSRLIWGTRSSLSIAVVSILFGTLVGGFLGLVAGYLGGRIGRIIGAITDILLAFPALLLALTLVAVLSPVTDTNPATYFERWRTVVLSVGIVSVPILARITRANALQWSQREFVMAARAQGAKSFRVMMREVLPNVVPAMLSIALLGIATVVIVEGGLAFFGVSISPPDASWGNMISSQSDLLSSGQALQHVLFAPSIAIFITVLSLNSLGDFVRRRFDVREAAI